MDDDMAGFIDGEIPPTPAFYAVEIGGVLNGK
jgi:hypothetical protein